MPVRPRKIKDAGLFTDDFRFDGGKFWFLQEPIRPTVQVGTGGRYIRPGMIEDESLVHAGNVGSPPFPAAFVDGQVWVVDHIGVFNGTAAAKLMGATIVFNGVGHNLMSDGAVGIAAPFALLHNDIYIDAPVNTQIVVGGVAADNLTIHARRVA